MSEVNKYLNKRLYLKNNNYFKKDGKRGISDFIFQTLGLGSVLSEIQNLGGNFVSQIMAIGSQLLFAGTQALNNAKPILAKLVSDLTNHVGDAATIVAQAIASLSQISGMYHIIIINYRKITFLVPGPAIKFYFFTWSFYLILLAFLKFDFLRNLIPGTNDQKVLL